MQIVTLTRHPNAPCPWVQRIDVRVGVSPNETLTLQYTLFGDTSQLRIPHARAQRREDRLWHHTCFEVFISSGNFPHYFELNFAPSAAWAAYRFDAYREGMAAIENVQPIIATQLETQELIVDVSVDLNAFLDTRKHTELRLALSAVIEDNGGALSHWALAHPPGKPDFHHADSFALTLNHPKNSA